MRWSACLVLLAIAASPAAVRAQEADAATSGPPPAEPAKPPALPELSFGGRVFARMESTSADDYARTFSLPVARLSVDAKIKKLLRISVEGDLADARPLKDAFLEVKLPAGLGVKAGRFKAPFSRRELTSIWDLELVHRGIVNAATRRDSISGRAVGAQLAWQPRFFEAARLQLGAFGGGGGDGEDLAGRLRLRPWRFLELGVSAMTRHLGDAERGVGADVALSGGGATLQLEALAWQPAAQAGAPAPAQLRHRAATALLTWRKPFGADLYVEPLAGAEWYAEPGRRQADALIGGVNLGKGDLLRMQVELTHGQLDLDVERRANRLSVQLGANF